MQASTVQLPVILIGPVNAGKSTLAPLLAEALGVDHVSLDDLSWGYLQEAGYEEEVAREHFERGGQAGALDYIVQFYPSAVERIVEEYSRSVIELGAGHTVYDDPTDLARVKAALAPHPNVVLLLPSPDLGKSIRILNARQGNPHPEIVQMNARFVRHPSNHELATITVYTSDRTPEATCREILTRLVSASRGDTRAEGL
ncbi:MAG TPA: shikimate kinase [Chloroflexota bacterium]|nr:shikimate kinase [Chloroflexota bacterium]